MVEETKSDLQIRREELETALPTTENKLAALMVQFEKLNKNVSSIKSWVTFFGIVAVIGMVITIIF